MGSLQTAISSILNDLVIKEAASESTPNEQNLLNRFRSKNILRSAILEVPSEDIEHEYPITKEPDNYIKMPAKTKPKVHVPIAQKDISKKTKKKASKVDIKKTNVTALLNTKLFAGLKK